MMPTNITNNPSTINQWPTSPRIALNGPQSIIACLFAWPAWGLRSLSGPRWRDRVSLASSVTGRALAWIPVCGHRRPSAFCRRWMRALRMERDRRHLPPATALPSPAWAAIPHRDRSVSVSPFGAQPPCGVRHEVGGRRRGGLAMPFRPVCDFRQIGRVGLAPGVGGSNAHHVRPFSEWRIDAGHFRRRLKLDALVFPNDVVVNRPAVKVPLTRLQTFQSPQRLFTVSDGALQPFRQVVINFGPQSLGLGCAPRPGTLP